jgi:hypothetical protein
MAVNTARLRPYITRFAFADLFIEELGWENYHVPLEVTVNGDRFTLQPVAQKRGLVVFHCPVIPENKLRRKIEQQVAKSHRENILVYTDAAHTEQIWQWVRREPGKPLANRERRFSHGQTGEAIAQVLAGIAFSLDEEDSLTIVDVTSRARAAFDIERVTKRFYDKFQKQHDAFMSFIEGIPDDDLHRWYASVMLNRLMFIYFIQKKGFLDGDVDYLRAHLSQTEGNYYREFLCPLFFAGFATKDHPPAVRALLGDVPYLNGGLFLRHQIEELHGEQIQIANQAFEKLFDFFDQYHWHLDENPLRADNEINPDVLGYIFEKYINQKQMGAYYTKEDITEYIGKNTVIPFLFDEARKAVKIAFEGDHTVWDLLAENPDRYIYQAVRHGAQHDLPAHIAAGLDDVSQRGDWNTPAPPEVALPTEIWREVVARRQRYAEVRAKLAAGEVRQINDLITLNLDIQQFAQDVLNYTDGPEVIRALWKALNRVTVLDPTCGSGAFLFAALNILEPLYEACLERMEGFVAELERDGDAHPQRYSDFRDVLKRIDDHPNRRYFILKSIVVNNLFGVDIMEEAVEICKLRLFLKLVAQVDDRRRMEPLPDIDFNIRAGNTLVGFATHEQLKQAITNPKGNAPKLMLLPEEQELLKAIEEKAQAVDSLFRRFREQQTTYGGEVRPEDKQALRARLNALADELNRLLAVQYGIDPTRPAQFEAWLKSHQPFHWFAEFYGVLSSGGFDVIIGNPPYLEVREVGYKLHNFVSGGPIHSACIERSSELLHKKGCMSMIVPLALVSTQRMKVVQELLENGRSAWYSNYSWRPAKLFDRVNRALTIFVVTPDDATKTYSTGYQKWTAETRDRLMWVLNYIEIPRARSYFFAPKVETAIETSVLKKVLSLDTTLGHFMSGDRKSVYYRTTGGLYWKVFTDFAPAFFINGKTGSSSRETALSLTDPKIARSVIAALSSDVFWWWYTISSNLRDLNPADIQGFPISKSALDDKELSRLGSLYLIDLQANSALLTRVQKQTGETQTQSFKVRKSKPIIDEIDRVLARHYGFTDEELDFIINYDIKYRMGDGLNGDEDGEIE